MQGGEGTYEEMCFAFMYYYPETDLTYCVGFQLVGEEFQDQHLRLILLALILFHNIMLVLFLQLFSDEEASVLISSMTYNDHQSVSEILNQVEWNQQSISLFQSAVQSSPITSVCINSTVR